MVVFPGDLFDRLLFLTDPYLNDILMFLTRFFKLMHKHHVVIRILEGTPAHDHKQSKVIQYVKQLIETVSENMEIDVKHVSELSIEYIEKLGITLLYIPDEWNIDVMDTYDEVHQLMQARGLQQVDFCLFHGAFNYQIDSSLNPKAHNEELWCKLVKYYLFAGHVHYSSQYKNILVGGSFDRLAHGEEQPKGWITCEIKPSGEHEIVFHENRFATIYETVDVRGKEVEEILTLLDEKLKDYPERSHIRLLTFDRSSIADGLDVLKRRYSHFYFTTKIVGKEEKPKPTLQLVSNKFESIQLDQDNIKRIVEDRLKTLQNVDMKNVLAILDRYL